jgi:hypothetical protein
MRQTILGKIAASVTLEIHQLERLNVNRIGTRVGRSKHRWRRDQTRREKLLTLKVDSCPQKEGSGTAAIAALRRP